VVIRGRRDLEGCCSQVAFRSSNNCVAQNKGCLIKVDDLAQAIVCWIENDVMSRLMLFFML